MHDDPWFDAPARPVLVIRSPRAGATVSPPWAVSYSIAGLMVNPNHPVHLQVTLADIAGHTMELTVKRQSGVLSVPDDRYFSGRRDVVFTLVRTNGTAYTNSRASVTVTNVTIAGNR